ncbi:MAG: CapA family protein [Actinomycetota bacterium]|jgi:poly-gamma-glutamate capsule biosynthesis protein CapA/YwtB (metallophosphatase superfamily)|nr:CapA family protein [Actinomycetota bacterium]
MASTTTVPVRGWLVVHGVGDTNFDESYIPNLGRHGFDFAFERLGGLFTDDDLTVINLECSPSLLGAPLDRAFTFRCDPDSLPVVAANGVEVANLANNHSRDYGIEAMLDGRSNVAGAGIAAVGVGVDVDEATSPAVVVRNGWTIAVLGMGGVVPGSVWLADEDSAGMASGDDIAQMTAAVEAAAEMADLVVVTIHLGWELETTPRADDRQPRWRNRGMSHPRVHRDLRTARAHRTTTMRPRPPQTTFLLVTSLVLSG